MEVTAAMERTDDDGRPLWDENDAQGLVTAYVLIGVTHLAPEGTRQEQMFGRIVAADREHGFAVALEGSRSGQTYWIPPYLRNFHAAAPGEYRLRSTGEVVVDPDYISSWTIWPPAAQTHLN